MINVWVMFLAKLYWKCFLVAKGYAFILAWFRVIYHKICIFVATTSLMYSLAFDIENLDPAGMAFGLGCFTSKVAYNTTIWISSLLSPFVNMDSSKTVMDGKYPCLACEAWISYCNCCLGIFFPLLLLKFLISSSMNLTTITSQVGLMLIHNLRLDYSFTFPFLGYV